jgi:HEPN domain-containing protein
MKNLGNPEEWLRRVQSNLERARIGRISEKILYEDLCFDCQQAVEKSLKGLLIHLGIDFPFTHSISALVNLIKESGLVVPDFVSDSAKLTVYAADTRYPPKQESVDEEEYKEALELAEQVYSWVVEILNK